jgi:predicted dehydrogenase
MMAPAPRSGDADAGGADVIGVGVVGTGVWAINMLRVIAESPRARLVAACDHDPGRLERARRFGPERLEPDAAAVLADPAIQAVYIATPPASHEELALAALAAGKHVLVEKPMTTSTAAARRLVAAAEAAGKVLMVGHTFLYSPPVRKIKGLIQDGSAGRVYYIDSQRVNLGRVQDSGVLWDLAPHDFSILFYWLDELPVRITAMGRSYVSLEREDVVFLQLEFASGVLAQVHLSWLAPTKLRRTTLSGSKQMIVYDDTEGPEAVKIYDQGIDRVRPPETFGEFQLTYRTGDITIPRLENQEPLRTEWEHFERCILEGQAPLTDGRHGLAVVKVIEAAAEAIRTRQPVEITWDATEVRA